jgi:hypothetical protein
LRGGPPPIAPPCILPLFLSTPSARPLEFCLINITKKVEAAVGKRPGRPSKVPEDIEHIEYMAELWCCGKSGQSFRKASRIAVGLLGADGKRKPIHAAQLAFQKRGGSQTRKPPPLIESVAERLARRLSSLDKQGLAIPLSLFCVFRQECSALYARSHPNARVALRLSSLSEITDLEQTVLRNV